MTPIVRTAVVLAFASVLARAQDESPPAAPAPVEQEEVSPAATLPTPEEVLSPALARARASSISQRLRVSVAHPDGPFDMASLVVRTDPVLGLARVEIGSIAIVADGTRIIAAHAMDPTTVFVREDPGPPHEQLARALPKLPSPFLGVAFGQAEPAWTPLTSYVAWTRAEPDAEGWVVTGDSGGRAVEARVEGDRLTSVRARVGTPEGEVTLTISIEELDDLAAEPWTIDATRRRRIASIAGLRPLGRRLEVGSIWPRVDLRRMPDGAHTGTETAFLPSDAVGAFQAILIFRPEAISGEEVGMLGAMVGAIAQSRRTLAGQGEGAPRLAALTGIVVEEQGGETLERLGAALPAWEALIDAHWQAGLTRPSLAWTAGEERVLDRLTPGGTGVLVLLDSTTRIREVIPIPDDGVLDAPSVASKLVDAATGTP